MLAKMCAIHGPSMLKWAMARSRHAGDAWDLVQDTFERALRACPPVSNQTELRRWLFTVLRNRHYDNCRSAEVRFIADVDVERLPDAEPEEVALWKRFDLSTVQGLVPQLSPPLRAVFQLYLAGCPSFEIARRLLIPAKTVATRMFRARRTLQRLLTGGAAVCESADVRRRRYDLAAEHPPAGARASVAVGRRIGKPLPEAFGHGGARAPGNQSCRSVQIHDEIGPGACTGADQRRGGDVVDSGGKAGNAGCHDRDLIGGLGQVPDLRLLGRDPLAKRVGGQLG
jgi:RNA polymerase sigma-70 factor (ECF subfamily)